MPKERAQTSLHAQAEGLVLSEQLVVVAADGAEQRLVWLLTYTHIDGLVVDGEQVDVGALVSSLEGVLDAVVGNLQQTNTCS